jgi:CubicO group peptidase (beta-lactamase class C family)
MLFFPATTVSSAEEADQSTQRQPLPVISAAEAAQSVGPGPLPPPLGERSVRSPTSKADTLEDAIDRCVERDMFRIGAPGAAVAVVLDGELIYESGYGLKHRLARGDVGPDTVFRIGSVTKMMTAAAVMQQVELGRVDLSAPVTDYIPDFEVAGRWPAERITVWNLLTHTTGFPDYIDDFSRVGNNALSVWAATQDGVELHAPPGSFWNYSNPNFMLAGLVAERASGVPYRDLLKQQLWEPAGMHATTFTPAEVIEGGDYSYGHATHPVTNTPLYISPTDNDLWAAGPAGFAFSTVGDLVHWALLLMDGGGPVLAPGSAATMQEPHQWMHYTPDRHYGFGIMVEEYEGLDVRQHGGNVSGYGTFLLWVPERRFAVALLANVTYSLTLAAYCIVDEVLDPPPVDPPDLSTDPSTWGRYVGDYSITQYDGQTADATVFLDGQSLMFSIEDPDEPGTVVTSELEQYYLDTFLFDSDGDDVVDNDATFCDRTGEPGFMMWFRNRMAVGERQLTPRRGGRQVSP